MSQHVSRTGATLDLRAQTVYESFVTAADGGRLLTFLLALDRLDRWTVDFGEGDTRDVFDVQLFLLELGALVECSSEVLHRMPRELSEVLAHLTTTRCLYLVRELSRRNPLFLDSLTTLLSAPNADTNLSAIKRRFEAFDRAQLLGEIFSEERLQRILTVMRSYRDG
ncbi:MAG: hypothetical protein JWL65_3332 [Gammaproteobacteria bacterium]|nr:hypothetical protein [Gammaproteobacteria bacterium]